MVECRYCGQEFDSERGLNIHIGIKHPKKAKKTIKCENCGKEFEVSPWEESEARFCSEECRNEWYRGRGKKYDYEKIVPQIDELYWDKGNSQYEIAEKLDIPRSTIERIMDKHDIKARDSGDALRLQRGIDFEKKWDANIFYIFGVLEGDGWYGMHNGRGKIALAVTDKKFAKTFKNALEQVGLNPFIYLSYPTNEYIIINDKKREIKSKKLVFRVEASCKPMVKWIQNLTYDDMYNNMEGEEHYASFLKGMYESDGSLTFTKSIKQLGISNTDLGLIDLIEKCLGKLDIKPFYTYNCGYYMRIRITRTNLILKFLDKIRPCIKNEVIKAENHLHT